jgi:hypothetical protein
MDQPKNVIFWGAGATAKLGIRTTEDQTQFIWRITGSHDKPQPPLRKRIDEALGENAAESLGAALSDLITILGDRDENYKSIGNIDDGERESMRRNWPGAHDKELDGRILHLRILYDWPALKSVVHICPGSSAGTFKLNDLFNLLDMHGPLGFGVRAPVPFEGGGQFFDARRLIGAKNALRMLLGALFYIDYQACIRSKGDVLAQYLAFASLLGHRMQRQGIDLACQYRLDQPEFYQGDVCFVSINYDPIALWVQFIANRELNNSASVPHIGSPAAPLHLFHDFGHLIPARRVEGEEANWPWYPMNEAVAQRLNEPSVSASRVRLTKFLFPHGCLCWRECPDCGKLSSYHGDHWKLDASGLFPPPPLLAFDTEACPDRIKDKERTQRKKGMIDARACLHCRTLTYAHHTQTVMQSSFKSQPPSFIEEIQRDLRAVTMQANHIIFMGYSLPLDDVTYRAFFSARCWRGKQTNESVRCTVVNLDNKHPDWYGPTELKNQSPPTGGETVKAAQDIFGHDNVRFYGGGIPNVFLDGGIATDAALERLLNWSSVL